MKTFAEIIKLGMSLILKTDAQGNAQGALRRGTRPITITYSNFTKKYDLIVGDEPIPLQNIDVPQAIARILVKDTKDVPVAGADVYIKYQGAVIFTDKSDKDGKLDYAVVNTIGDDGIEKMFEFSAKKDAIFTKPVNAKVFCPEGADIALVLEYEKIVKFHAKDAVNGQPVKNVTISMDEGVICYTDDEGNFYSSAERGHHKCVVGYEGKSANGEFDVTDDGVNVEITIGRTDDECRTFATDNFGVAFGTKLEMTVAQIITAIAQFVKTSTFNEAIAKLLPRPATPATVKLVTYNEKNEVGLAEMKGGIVTLAYNVPQAETGKTWAVENPLFAKYLCDTTILEELMPDTDMYRSIGTIAPKIDDAHWYGDYDVYYSNDTRVNVDFNQRWKKKADKTNMKIIIQVMPIDRKTCQPKPLPTSLLYQIIESEGDEHQ